MVEDKKQKHRNKLNRMIDAETKLFSSCFIPVASATFNITTKSMCANI